jgi:hypothetical protein
MSGQGVEFCQQQDLPELFACFAHWYRFNPRMQECDYFDWQFKHAPHRLADSEYDFLVLREGGSIKGCLGFTGFEFEHAGQTAIGGWTHNWYAQDQRDGGLALLLRFMELVDNRFIIRFNDNTAQVFSLLRVPMMPALPRWWAAIDAQACVGLFGFDEQDVPVITQSERTIRKLEHDSDVRAIMRFDPSESFYFSYDGVDIAGAKRSGRYLNWRYFDAPKHSYRAVTKAGQFAIFRIEPVMDSPASVIRILEWTFDSKDAASVLAWIMKVAGHQRPILMDFHCSCGPIGRVLEPLGFVRQSATAKPMPDLFRPIKYSGGIAMAIDLPPHRTVRQVNFGQWYITAGDSDVDRVKL